MSEQLTAARQLADWGFNVLPARGKAPAVTWQKFQDQRTDGMLELWFGGSREYNYWSPCGRISGVVVLDVDNRAAEEYWYARIGDLMDATACVQTSKGHHYYFRLLPDQAGRSWGQHDDELSFDVRGEGTGVIVPPSVHESGHVYEWVRDPSQGLVDLPEALFGPESGSEGGGGASVRSVLAELLSHPPTGENSGRNDWLAHVAGHYAKLYRSMPDAYEAHCRMAHSQLDTPLDDAEFTKTVESIWRKENQKPEQVWRAEECTHETGWLVSGGDYLLTLSKRGNETELEQWSDFDVVATGIAQRDDVLTYDILLRRHNQHDEVETLLPASVLANPQRLASWLANHGVGILAPQGELRNLGSRTDRIHRYLQSQNPPAFEVVDALGWNGFGFVCHEGIITAAGLEPFDRVRPDPALRNRAPHTYGFTEPEQARAVLNQVLTFHDETVCSVFGAWWAAALLKPQLAKLTSLFPFMALEAPSESGKTTGYFSLMLQLAGDQHGQLNPTWAALRDMVASHQSGIVWIDDLDDPARLMELLRQSTGEGGLVKKGDDNFSQVEVKLVSPVVISGEALNLHGQKALADRAVQLEVPSPVNRRSLHDSDKLQWDDILDLRKVYPDLTVFAGNMVQMALASADESLRDFRDLRQGGGRFGDKIAVLQVGARLLSAMTGDLIHIERVSEWAREAVTVGNENALTLKLIPAALAQLDWPTKISSAEGRWPATCVFVKGEHVWFSPAFLARWWSELNHGRVEMRTETTEALSQQAKSLGLGGQKHVDRRPFRIGSFGDNKSSYWRLPLELSEMVLRRSRGEADVGGIIVEELRLLSLPAGTDAGWDVDPTIGDPGGDTR